MSLRDRRLLRGSGAPEVWAMSPWILVLPNKASFEIVCNYDIVVVETTTGLWVNRLGSKRVFSEVLHCTSFSTLECLDQ